MKKDESITSIPDLYNKISQTYANEYHKVSYKIDEFIKLLPENAKVLDIGCGPGKDAKYMAERKFDVYGIDLSEEMVKLAKENNPGCKFDIADMRNLDLEPNSFDGIFVSFFLIHIPKKDMVDVIKKINYFLKPEGILFVGVQEGEPDEITVAHPLDQQTKFFLNVISSKELRQVLKDNGFGILKQYSRPAMFEKELNFNKLVLIAKNIRSV